jgi:hypothetical protein
VWFFYDEYAKCSSYNSDESFMIPPSETRQQFANTVKLHLSGPSIIRIGLALGVKLSRILQKLTCLEITGYRIKYNTVLRLLELQIRRGRKCEMQVRTVNSKSRTSNRQCGLFSKKKSDYPDFLHIRMLRRPN